MKSRKLVQITKMLLLGFNYPNLFPKLFFKMLAKTDIQKTKKLPEFLVNSTQYLSELFCT